MLVVVINRIKPPVKLLSLHSMKIVNLNISVKSNDFYEHSTDQLFDTETKITNSVVFC